MAKKKEEVTQEHRAKTTKEKRSLRCYLTQEELLAAGERLAELLDNLRGAESERESVVKQYKAKEAELAALIESQQLLVRNKSEIRMVDCVNVLDYTDVRCIVTRLDTGEIVVNRKLTEDEKQSTLEFDGEMPENKTTAPDRRDDGLEEDGK
jgi:flagellar basal body rod protein FlgC